jgi:anti-anti-sigma factor
LKYGLDRVIVMNLASAPPHNYFQIQRDSFMTQVRTDKSGDTLTIHLPKTFNMATYHDFNDAYKDHIDTTASYILDFSMTDHLDSAALGLLLLLRQRVGQTGRIQLVHLSDSVQNALEIAQFQKLFEIPEMR